MVRAIVSGTPSAVPLMPAKLDLMSLRTAPVSGSTFGPFEPSPGNGPAVSSGTLAAHTAPPPVVPVPVVPVPVVPVVVDGEVGLLSPPQPISWRAPKLAPMPPANVSRRRRPTLRPVARRSRWRPPKSS